jgi:MmyB-like transcription regulator ligand binding domain
MASSGPPVEVIARCSSPVLDARVDAAQAVRSLCADWRAAAQGIVANLRLYAGRYPHDPALAELVGDLSVQDPDFRRLWASVRSNRLGVPEDLAAMVAFLFSDDGAPTSPAKPSSSTAAQTSRERGFPAQNPDVVREFRPTCGKSSPNTATGYTTCFSIWPSRPR